MVRFLPNIELESSTKSPLIVKNFVILSISVLDAYSWGVRFMSEMYVTLDTFCDSVL